MTRPSVVVITGASAGVGRATAKAFARKGARVAVLARGVDGLEGARQEIEAAGGEAMVIPVDVADHDQLESAADKVETQWGPIDVWVNNAMVTVFSPFAEIAPEDFRRVTDVTYHGYVWGTQVALKRMQPRNRGVIVQVGSALAYRSIPLQSAYCGAKSAIRGFTDSIRSELIHDKSKVKITMVHLSAFNTPQFEWGRTTMTKQPQPLPPIFQPEVAANAIVWAANNPRREFWVGFPATKAILGNKFLAPILDHLMAHQAYSGQQMDKPLPDGRKDNLYNAVPGDFGAHGRFDDQAKTHSWQVWLNMHRGKILAASAIALGTALWKNKDKLTAGRLTHRLEGGASERERPTAGAGSDSTRRAGDAGYASPVPSVNQAHERKPDQEQDLYGSDLTAQSADNPRLGGY